MSTALPRSLLLLFALPGILQAFMLAPSNAILQGVYAKEAGIGLIALGTALFVVRIFDLCSDLLIGFLSDRSAQRGISRKLWIGAGTVVSVVSMWFLFRPPAGVSVTYFGFWFLMANIGWSLVEIPYRSWGLGFSPDPNERARIFVWITIASLVGGLLFYGVPPAGKALGLLDSDEYNLQMLALTAVVVAVLLPPLNLLTLLRMPDSKNTRPSVPTVEIPKESFALVFRSVAGNGPLLRLLLTVVIYNLASGMSAPVSLLYTTNYLLLPSSVNAVFALALPVTLIGIPLWIALIKRYDYQKVWAISMAISAVFYASMGFLQPQPSVALLTTLFCLSVFFMFSAMVIVPVILGDVVDYGKRKFGVERTGLYVSLKAQVDKGVSAVSAGAGFIILGWAGFDATKSGADLTPQAVLALKFVMGGIPALGMFITAALLWFMPVVPREQRAGARDTKLPLIN